MSELIIWVEECVPIDLTLKSGNAGNSGLGGFLMPLILIESSIESSIVIWLLSTDAENWIFEGKPGVGENIYVITADITNQGLCFIC